MNTTKTYNHVDFGEINVLVGGKGNVWFYGEEIAECAGFCNPCNAVNEYVEKDEKKEIRRKHRGVTKTYTIVNIYGALSLVLSSKMVYARDLKSWLAKIDFENRPKLSEDATYVKAFVVSGLRAKVNALTEELKKMCEKRDYYRRLYMKQRNTPLKTKRKKKCQQTSESVS